eukprot:3635578-Rhodomonas_salina.1
MGMVGAGGRLCVIGGCNSFDTDSKTTCSAVGEKLYVFGGLRGRFVGQTFYSGESDTLGRCKTRCSAVCAHGLFSLGRLWFSGPGISCVELLGGFRV